MGSGEFCGVLQGGLSFCMCLHVFIPAAVWATFCTRLSDIMQVRYGHESICELELLTRRSVRMHITKLPLNLLTNASLIHEKL